MRERHGLAGLQDHTKMVRPKNARVTVEDGDDSVVLILATGSGDSAAVGLTPDEALYIAAALDAAVKRLARKEALKEIGG